MKLKINTNKIIELKIQKHFEKIREIFQIHSDEYQEKLSQERLNLKTKAIEPPPAKKSVKASEKSKKSEKSEESDAESQKDQSKQENSDKDSESEGEKEKSLIDDNAIVIPVKSPTIVRTPTNVKLSKMDRVLNDISYLTGLGILTAEEAKNIQDFKKSSIKGIDEFIHFIWLKKHMNKCEEKHFEKGKLEFYLKHSQIKNNI